MADKVGLKRSEYEQLGKTISEAHRDNEEQIQKALTQLSGVHSSGGAFYTKDISPKVEMIITQIREISNQMSGVYSTHEAVIKSFESAVSNYDTCC